MLKARHSVVYQYILSMYLAYYFRTHFHEVRIIGEYKEMNEALFLTGNHISWWDGFFALYLNKQIFRKNIHVMMLETELRKNMILNRNGAFSIAPGTRSMIESLKYAGELLNSPQNLLVVYPQGKIQSLYNHQIAYEQGWYNLLKYTKQPFQWVFYAAFTDYGKNPKPTLNLYFQQYSGSSFTSADEVEHAYQQFYHTSLQTQQKLIW